MSERPLKRFCSERAQYGLNTPASEYTTEGLRFIRTTDIVSTDELTPVADAVYLDESAVEPPYRLTDGDLLLGRSGTLGRCLRYQQEHHGPATFAGYLVRFRPDLGADPRYLAYCTQSRGFMEAIESEAISSTISNFNAERYASLRLPWWPLDTQRAIADYLDAETARIDALIAKKRHLIEVLDERRREFVSGAVTEGLGREGLVETGNPFAPRIPRDWGLLRLRHAVTSIIDTAHKTAPVVDDGGYLVVRTANVKQGRLVMANARFTDEVTWREWTLRGAPTPGDVMFTREAPAGECCLVPEGVPLCIGQRMVLLQVDPTVVSGEWLVHSIYSGAAQRFIAVLSKSTTVAHINMSDIPDIPLAVPPPETQETILRSIRQVVERAESAMQRLDEQIALLGEHRQALITAAVTGELEVAA